MIAITATVAVIAIVVVTIIAADVVPFQCRCFDESPTCSIDGRRIYNWIGMDTISWPLHFS